MSDLDHAALLLRLVVDEFRALGAMEDRTLFSDAKYVLGGRTTM
ncbi:MAG: hypothetical protein ACYC5Q_11245 [Thermoleophilia bacterium]